MTIKREAAFHEAGHAVTAHRSRFHAIVGPINLADYGSGQAYVSLSKRKLLAAGKSVSQAAAVDREVAIDLAVVLAAGLVAERIAAGREAGLTPAPACAAPDHKLAAQILTGAGLPFDIASHEESAGLLLEQEWGLVTALAEHLLRHVSLDPLDDIDFMDDHG